MKDHIYWYMLFTSFFCTMTCLNDVVLTLLNTIILSIDVTDAVFAI